MTNFVAPTGYVELDNDCTYSIDRKSTRSREEVNPKDDLAFYFNTYIAPKYGLNNLNVNNVASFMKDLEMNWTKLDTDLKSKVLDIMVDGILSKDGSFKTDLLKKLGISGTTTGGGTPFTNVQPPPPPIPYNVQSRSTFGSTNSNTILYIIMAVGALVFAFIIYTQFKKNKAGGGYPKFK